MEYQIISPLRNFYYCVQTPFIWKPLLLWCIFNKQNQTIINLNIQTLLAYMKRRIILEIINCLIILLFVYAATSKLLDYDEFKIQLGKSPFINEFAGVTAWALPIGEILVGVALTFTRTRLLGLYASLFLMTMFSAYIYAMLHYSYYIPCSCGGILSKMGWTTHLWFNIGFVLLSIIGILLQASEYKRQQLQEKVKIEEEYPSSAYATSI